MLPPVTALLDQSERKSERLVQKDITLQHGDKAQTLHITIAAERSGDRLLGSVVTFDDITELMSAQRSAAWADVARRIAHEIKNPLTPITLSAERLRKKFADEITSDREAFLRYTDTIGRHVKDIGRMVEEFVSFARMPAPNFRLEDIAQIVRKIVFSEQTAHPDIAYAVTIDPEPLKLVCDEQQVRQLFTNLLKNAAEALETTQRPTIRIDMTADDETVTVDISDNGPGFPSDKIATLTEPYVTTRSKGTGLGLAIVKKSMEDHKGSIALTNRPENGAKVTLIFSRNIQVDLPKG